MSVLPPAAVAIARPAPPGTVLADSGVSFVDVVTTPALLALAVLAALVLTGTALALWALWRTRPR